MNDTNSIDRRAALLLGLCLGLYPLLAGGIELWAQVAVRAILLGGFFAWALGRALAGKIPSPGGLPWIPLTVGGGWLLACALSPAPGFCHEALVDGLAGLCVLYWTICLPRQKRDYIFHSVIFASWVMAALAVYQLLGGQDVSASFLNHNAFACWLVMLAAALYARGNRVQAVLFAALLCGTHSRGALLALASVFTLYLVFRRSFLKKIIALFIALCVGIAIHHMNGFSLGERYMWWQAAVAMIRERPWTGFGPGLFGYAYPAFHVPGTAHFGSTFAHSYPLQLAAETGIVFCALWLGWILWRVTDSRGWARGAVLGALLMSLTDYVLVTGPNFFLFCMLLGTLQEEPQSADSPSPPRRLLAALAALCALFAVLPVAFKELAMAQALASANACAVSGDASGTLSRLEFLCAQNPKEPVAALELARSYETLALARKDRGLLVKAASSYENALEANPFNPGVYDELAGVYEKLGEKKLSGEVFERKAENIRWWKQSVKTN